MQAQQIMAQARYMVGDVDGRRFVDPLLFDWIDAGARQLVDQTELLQEGAYQTLVNGIVTAATTVIVDDSKYFRVGDRIDIITALGVKEATNQRIASIAAATNTLTLAAAVTCADNSQVWFRNDKGSIDLVADSTDYFTPWSALRVKQVRIKHSSSSQFRVLPQIEQAQTALGRAQLATWPAGSQRETWVFGYVQLGQEVIQLYPAPGTAITDGLVVTYVRRPMYMITAEDEPDFDDSYHQGLVHFLAMQMYGLDGNADAAGQQAAMFQTYIDRGRRAMGFPTDVPNIRPQAR